MYRQYDGLIIEVSRQYSFDGIYTRQDILQEGYIAIMISLQIHDSTKGSLSTCIYNQLRKRFWKLSRHNKKRIKEDGRVRYNPVEIEDIDNATYIQDKDIIDRLLTSIDLERAITKTKFNINDRHTPARLKKLKLELVGY